MLIFQTFKVTFDLKLLPKSWKPHFLLYIATQIAEFNLSIIWSSQTREYLAVVLKKDGSNFIKSKQINVSAWIHTNSGELFWWTGSLRHACCHWGQSQLTVCDLCWHIRLLCSPLLKRHVTKTTSFSLVELCPPRGKWTIWREQQATTDKM